MSVPEKEPAFMQSSDPFLGRLRGRVRAWIKVLYQDPSAEERTIMERRQRLLDELAQAVADAPDDVPIRTVIERLNRHRED